jgi:hypothetical protein
MQFYLNNFSLIIVNKLNEEALGVNKVRAE